MAHSTPLQAEVNRTLLHYSTLHLHSSKNIHSIIHVESVRYENMQSMLVYTGCRHLSEASFWHPVQRLCCWHSKPCSEQWPACTLRIVHETVPGIVSRPLGFFSQHNMSCASCFTYGSKRVRVIDVVVRSRIKACLIW